MREDAQSIFQAGISAANPFQAVKQCLQVKNNVITLALEANGQQIKRSGQWQTVHLIACGKAAVDMMKAAQLQIPSELLASPSLLITNYENVQDVIDCEVHGASHPLPDEAGFNSAQHLADRLLQAKQGELIILLLSGGASALVPYPLKGISLQEKIDTTTLLLGSGATINEVNCVRKHLSQLKGGQMASLATPADLHTFILSDVIGDDLSSIASGPTVPDNTRFTDAIQILKHRQIWEALPASVRQVLLSGEQGDIDDTPAAGHACFETSSHTLVSSNRISVKAIEQQAQQSGYVPVIFSEQLTGEARDAASSLLNFAHQYLEENKNVQPIAIIAGGETTVTLNGNGLGGRNQEMALAFAIAEQKHPLNAEWTFLSGGTDGRDGPTNAAGGVVDRQTFGRISNPEQFLANNDSYHALKQAGDLLMTGATGTNVADLQVLLCKRNDTQ